LLAFPAEKNSRFSLNPNGAVTAINHINNNIVASSFPVDLESAIFKQQKKPGGFWPPGLGSDFTLTLRSV
jgi:hypothetical protein